MGLKDREFNVDIHKPYIKLTEEEKKIVWEGKGVFKGLNKFFKYLIKLFF